MAQIAVSPSPVPAPVASPAPSGQFSAALSQATQNTQDASPTPGVSSKSGSSGRGSTSVKDNGKSSTKPSTSSQSQTSATVQLANLPSDTPVKIPNNILFSGFVPSLPLHTSSAADAPDATDKSLPGSTPDSDAAVKGIATTNLAEVAKPVPVPAAAPAKNSDANVFASSSGKALPQPAPLAKSSTANEKLSIEQNAKTSPEPATPVTKPAAPETKSASHEGTESDSTPKTAGTPSSAAHNASAANIQQTATTALPQVQLPDIKTVPATAAPTAASSPVKTNSDAVPSSSNPGKKDGDSGQNAASQSQKNESGAAIQSAISKASSSAGQAQPNGVATPNASAANQVSQAVTDVKAATASVTPKATEVGAKNQLPTTTPEVDAVVEAKAGQMASPIQVAKLVEQAGQAELHVGIQAGEFGSVDIRTSMAHSQFTAEISVERGELGRAMSAELPALHDRLAEQRVPAANIILQDNSYSGHSSSGFQQGGRQNQYQAQNQGSFVENADAISPVSVMESLESSTGLDIHI